jgi:hypothetical protein
VSRTVANLVADLRSYFGAPPLGACDAIDRGTPRRLWSAGAPPRCEIRGADDGRRDDAELIQEAFLRLEAIRFGAPSFEEELTGPGRDSSFLRWFRGHSLEIPRAWVTPGATRTVSGDVPFLPPWLIDDADAATTADREARAAIDAAVGRAREASGRAGFAADTPQGRADIAHLLEALLHHPRAEGGLGMRYEFLSDRSHWRSDAVQAYEQGVGDCNALSSLYFAMAERAGLNPQFIRISGRRITATGTMEELFHVGVGVVTDPSHPETLTPIDPSAEILIDDRYEWFPITEAEMAAYHLRNVALRNAPAGADESSVLSAQEYILGQAVSLAPNFEVMMDAAWFYRNRLHQEERAAPLEEAARLMNPSLQAVW